MFALWMYSTHAGNTVNHQAEENTKERNVPLPIVSSVSPAGSIADMPAICTGIIMDIAALSYSMKTAELQNDIGYAIMGNVLDQVEIAGDGMQKILESSVTPNLGQNIDYSV